MNEENKEQEATQEPSEAFMPKPEVDELAVEAEVEPELEPTEPEAEPVATE